MALGVYRADKIEKCLWAALHILKYEAGYRNLLAGFKLLEYCFLQPVSLVPFVAQRLR